jgi:hypothetical protein
MANAMLGWGLSEVRPEKSCQLTGAGVIFDFEEYVTRIYRPTVVMLAKQSS